MSDRPATPSLRERLRGALARGLTRLPAAFQRRLSGRPPIQIDGQTLDPSLQLLLAVRPRGERAPLTAGSPAAARARFRREILSIRAEPTLVGSVRDLMVAGGAGPLRARHYAPGDANRSAPPPLLVYYHGGGFTIGDVDTHDELCRLLCRHGGQQVLSVEYRLAPEHPFPAAADDAVAAFRWAQAHAAELGADPDRVGVGGDSAGGNLAAVVAQRTAREWPPAAQLLLYPPTDRTTERASHRLFDEGFFLSLADRDAFSAYYLAGSNANDADPGVSPLLAADLSGLAPALVVTAGFDVLRDEGEAYAEALAEAGTPCVLHREASLAHGFAQLTPVCPAARRAMVALARRWNALLSATAQHR